MRDIDGCVTRWGGFNMVILRKPTHWSNRRMINIGSRFWIYLRLFRRLHFNIHDGLEKQMRKRRRWLRSWLHFKAGKKLRTKFTTMNKNSIRFNIREHRNTEYIQQVGNTTFTVYMYCKWVQCNVDSGIRKHKSQQERRATKKCMLIAVSFFDFDSMTDPDWTRRSRKRQTENLVFKKTEEEKKSKKSRVQLQVIVRQKLSAVLPMTGREKWGKYSQTPRSTLNSSIE